MKKLIKRGQEEIIGFVLIVVVIAIVFLVFLGISIRNGNTATNTDSTEVYQFLESSMEFTSDCAFNSVPNYFKLSDLFEECLSNNRCIDGKDTCIILEDALKGVLNEGWNVDPEGSIKGYEFISEYTTDSPDQIEEIISVEEGECLGNVKGASFLIPAFPGKIKNVLIICS